MADVIQAAPSGRSKCRGCGQPIANGALRFGETLPNPYAEGETQYWFHLTCAACMRPEKTGPAIEASELEVPEREWLLRAAAFGVAHRRLPRLVRAERSKSGKARCRSCREPIPGGVMRLGLQMFEEGRASPIGFIHVECALAYFGTADILDRIEKLTADLDESARAELVEQLGRQREPSPESTEASEAAGPDLAKTRPSEGDDVDADHEHAQSS